MEFIKQKRSELHRLNITTFMGVIIGTVAIAAFRGHATRKVMTRIFIANSIGAGFGYFLSYVSK